MKRIANPINTDALCSYGCGEVAKFINGSNRLMCCERSNSCKAIRLKNSESTKKANANRDYKAQYNNLSEKAKQNIAWNKGKYSVDFSYNGRGNHKAVLIQERGHCCEECTVSIWNDKPITLELEHIDGDNKNNNKDNLKLLCPNCHSQTPTWRRAKKAYGKHNRRYTDEEIINVVKTSTGLNDVLMKLDLRYGSAYTVLKVMADNHLSFNAPVASGN